jgi:RNA polymerase sigma factor (sigma-70 family)
MDQNVDWNAIVDVLGPKLFRYFCGSFSSLQAQDLVQETLLRLVRKHGEGSFDPAKGTIQTYAFGIAHLVRLEALKRIARENNLATSLLLQVPEENPQSEARLLRESIDNLKEAERQVVLLHINEDLSLAEISECLEIPLGTVKSHLHRAKETLKERLRRTRNE